MKQAMGVGEWGWGVSASISVQRPLEAAGSKIASPKGSVKRRMRKEGLRGTWIRWAGVWAALHLWQGSPRICQHLGDLFKSFVLLAILKIKRIGGTWLIGSYRSQGWVSM